MVAEPPQAREYPREQCRRLEIQVLDELEHDGREQHDDRQPEGDSLAAGDAAGEKQQAEARQNRAGSAAKGHGCRQQRLQDLGAGLMVHDQRPDDVDHGADNQEAGEKDPHPAPLDPGLVAHANYNATDRP